MNKDCALIVAMLLLALAAAPALAQPRSSRATPPLRGLTPNDSPSRKGLTPADGSAARGGGNRNAPIARVTPSQNTGAGNANTDSHNDTSANGNTPERPINPGEPPSPGGASVEASLFSAVNILIGVSIALVLLMLALHIVHLMSTARMKQDIASAHDRLTHLRQQAQQMNQGLQNLSLRAPPPPNPANDDAAALTAQQQNAIEQLRESLEEVRRLTLDNGQAIASTSKALALHAQLAGRARLRREEQNAAGEQLEAERVQVMAMTERYRDLLAANANTVKPLVEAFAGFSHRVKRRTHLPPELAAYLQTLEGEIRQFEHWQAEADERLASLRRGSFRERLQKFHSGEQRLGEAFNFGGASILQYIEDHDALMQQLLVSDGDAGDARRSPAEQEGRYKKLSASAPDHLMNWFDKLFQLQTQLDAASGSVDTQTGEELASIQNLAKDTLGRFDIQPEEIQAGRTSFDNRLYDAALVTQSSQYPANTVIGVQQCGFRRRSTGEVLRRPKVIVAGLGVAS